MSKRQAFASAMISVVLLTNYQLFVSKGTPRHAQFICENRQNDWGFAYETGRQTPANWVDLLSLSMDPSKNHTHGTTVANVQVRNKFGRLWNQTSPLEQLLQAKSLERKGFVGLSWDRLRLKMVAWGHF